MQRVAINERRGMLLPELHPEYASVGAGSCGLPRPGGERVGVRGFGIAGRVSDRPEPPHPALSPLGRGRRTRSRLLLAISHLLFAHYFTFFARNAIERCQARSAAAF